MARNSQISNNEDPSETGVQIPVGTMTIVRIAALMGLIQAVVLVFNVLIAKDYNLYILSVSFGMGLFVLAALVTRFLRNNIPTQPSITISVRKFFKLKVVTVLLFLAWAIMQIIIYLSVSVWAPTLGFVGYYQLDVPMQIGIFVITVALSLLFMFMPIKKVS